MRRTTGSLVAVVGAAILAAGASILLAAEEPVDKFMGDWQGTIKADGKDAPVVAQVLALGDGKYDARILEQFDVKANPKVVLNGTLTGEKVTFGDTASIESGKFTGKLQDAGTFEMKRVVRASPTLGAKPPEGAVVLFDGKSMDEWQQPNGKPCGWKLLDDGSMEVVPGKGSIISKKTFTDHRIHVEFRTPFTPKARGQGRGNSGVYLQGRYEIQVLDSYALAGLDNECGGIYKVAAPKVNMCYPPMQWQTYDATFKAPRFDAEGKRTSAPSITVLHNGVEIHKDVELPGATTASQAGDAKLPGGLYLQDHSNPVQYRNIWVVETK